MKINKLRIKNMYGVKGDVEYDLSPRIVGLFGKNGAGKSSVINSLKLAIGGEKTSSAMLRGVDNSAVRIQTDTVTIDRQLKKTETGSVMTGWIDGKKTPGNRIQIDLASRLETTKDNLKTLSSKDIEKSLAENAGKILLSFADDELTSSEVKELLTKEAGETTDFNKEDINKVRFPDHIMWQDAESIASEYKKKTSGLRAEIKGMEATYSSIHLADLGNAEIPSAEEAKEEYDTLIKKEALYTEGQKLLKNYERMNVTRETTLKSIQEKLEEVAKLGEVRSLDVVKAEKNQLFEQGNKLNTSIAAAKSTVSALQPLYDKMGTGVCPLSCNGVDIKCCTDMTETKSSVKSQIDAAKAEIEKCTKEMETLKEERDKVLSELSLAEKKTKMQTEIESMEKALPEKIEKPKVEELKDEEKQRKTFLSNVLKNNELKVQQMQIVKKIKERKKLFYLADFIAKQFSQKGIVSQNLLGKYIKTLTDAASKAEAETGIRVIFKNDNGISISYCINGDVDTENGRDYETLSEGEKMLAFLTVTDLLHRIANIPVLLLDNVDKLDAENFDHLLTLLDRVADSYENIIIAGVDHEEFTSILEKHNIPNILQ